MKGALALRKPLAPSAVLDTSVTGVGSSYVGLVTLSQACSAVVVANTGANPMKLAIGAPGVEVENGIVIPAGGTSQILPCEIPKNTRVSVKNAASTLTTQSTGIVSVMFFQ